MIKCPVIAFCILLISAFILAQNTTIDSVSNFREFIAFIDTGKQIPVSKVAENNYMKYFDKLPVDNDDGSRKFSVFIKRESYIGIIMSELINEGPGEIHQLLINYSWEGDEIDRFLYAEESGGEDGRHSVKTELKVADTLFRRTYEETSTLEEVKDENGNTVRMETVIVSQDNKCEYFIISKNGKFEEIN